jgi:hypothetical protein
MAAEFDYDSCVRGYHVYQSIWIAIPGQMFSCEIEEGNTKDRYAVSIVRSGTGVIGHIPRKISAACSIFIRRGGSIFCKVTGNRRYSHDLVQEGLEVPCVLTFKGIDTEINKLRKLLEPSAPTLTCVVKRERGSNGNEVEDCANPSKQICDIENHIGNSDGNQLWLQLGNWKLTLDDASCLLDCKKELTDKHINFAQAILKAKFPTVTGFYPTMFQQRSRYENDLSPTNSIQIIHCRHMRHWATLSTINCTNEEVKIYDSVYSCWDQETEDIVAKLFHKKMKISMEPVQKQQGNTDCGIFSIAFAIALAANCNPSLIVFNQSSLRSHIKTCFEKLDLTVQMT